MNYRFLLPYCLLLCTAATPLNLRAQSPAGAPLTVTSPLDWQVFQRSKVSEGVMHLAGSLPPDASVQWRLTGTPRSGVLPGGWQALPTRSGSSNFAADVKVPAGGWYQLEVQAVHGAVALATTTVAHVGVGEIFVVIGQSNSTNYGSEKQQTKTGMVSSFDGHLWHLANDPQIGADGGDGSFMPAFGDAIATQFRVPVAVVARGVGSTSVREWLPQGEKVNHPTTTGMGLTPAGPGLWESNGVHFANLSTALAALGPHGFRAILWHQGESDAGQARSGYPAIVQISGDDYARDMAILIKASRRAAGWEVPWFTAQATYHSATDAADPEFRAAQKAVWDSGLAQAGPDTDTLGPAYRGTVHMNAHGLQKHGEMWAEKVTPWLEAQLRGRGTVDVVSPPVAATPPVETPAQAEARTEWWRDDRFGMFIHWDISSLVGTEISWSRHGSKPLDITGDPAGYVEDAMYDHLYEKFDPEKFDAAAWVRIAQSAGMKYIVFTAKHHGGFCMWDTKFTDYNIMHTPFHRDVVKELADACHRAGMRFGIYYSPRDWHQPDYGIGDNAKYVAYMNGQLRELLTKYGKVDLLWFDSYGYGDMLKFWRVGETWALIKSLQPHIMINNRLNILGDYDKQPAAYVGDFFTPEQTLGAFTNTRLWESCITLSAASTWSYRPHDKSRSFVECIHTLASCATGDGNTLLDVGPSPLGEITDDEVTRLAEIGAWMKKCGASIYGTRGGPYANKGKWGGSTYRGKTVYLHIFTWNGDTLELPPLKAKVLKVTNLSDPSAAPAIQQDVQGITLTLPSSKQDPADTVIALDLSGPAVDEMNQGQPLPTGTVATRPAADGTLTLTAAAAEIQGGPARLEGMGENANIGYWTSTDSIVKWNARLAKPGSYTVKLTYACSKESQGCQYTIKAGDLAVNGTIVGTDGFSDYRTVTVGVMNFATAGPLSVILQPISMQGFAVMNLQKVELLPVR